MVSEIGFGAEWMERHTAGECKAVLVRAEELGINILDCWMSNPEVRTSLGLALAGRRERWYIQGHIGSTWQDGQYVRTRDVGQCRAAFEDLLERLQTDYSMGGPAQPGSRPMPAVSAKAPSAWERRWALRCARSSPHPGPPAGLRQRRWRSWR